MLFAEKGRRVSLFKGRWALYGCLLQGRGLQLQCRCSTLCSPRVLTRGFGGGGYGRIQDTAPQCYSRGEEDDQISEKSRDSRADLLASLPVFEYTGLEFTLKVASREDDSFN